MEATLIAVIQRWATDTVPAPCLRQFSVTEPGPSSVSVLFWESATVLLLSTLTFCAASSPMLQITGAPEAPAKRFTRAKTT